MVTLAVFCASWIANSYLVISVECMGDEPILEITYATLNWALHTSFPLSTGEIHLTWLMSNAERMCSRISSGCIAPGLPASANVTGENLALVDAHVGIGDDSREVIDDVAPRQTFPTPMPRQAYLMHCAAIYL